MINGNWCTDHVIIKLEALKFFQSKFHEEWPVRPAFRSNLFRKITDNDKLALEAPITLQEIKNAVWACGNDKSPGPDGFTFKFIKKYWEVLLGDIAAVVKYFELHGKIDPSCNSSFISLLPKIKDPQQLKDYRPISLIGCIYKIIANILAVRLKLVMGQCIDEVQTTYVVGRNILDGPLLVNEICAWSKKVKKKILLLKVDFDKAFDSVNWEFLNNNLIQMGFGNKWRGWIKGCLTSSKSSVLINGTPTNEFTTSKGVCQGDPLSPLLFITAMEGLSVAMKEVCVHGVFQGLQLPNEGPTI